MLWYISNSYQTSLQVQILMLDSLIFKWGTLIHSSTSRLKFNDYYISLVKKIKTSEKVTQYHKVFISEPPLIIDNMLESINFDVTEN